MKTTGKKINGRKVFTYVFLTIAALISLFPFYFMFVSATNTNAEILSATPKLIFGSHLVENFKNLNKKMDILRILMNSAIMTVTYTALSIVLHSMAGYALAKFEFKGKGLLFSLIMVTMMIPSQVMYVPLFTLMNNIGWADTYQAVVLPGLAGAFGIFLMRQNMLAFPTSLIEAARIDGSGEFRTFNTIVLPLMKPAIAVQAIFTFVANWNNYFTPALVLHDDKMKTLPILIAQLRSADFLKFDMGQVYVTIAFSIFPVIIVYLFLSKYIVQGVAMGSVKG